MGLLTLLLGTVSISESNALSLELAKIQGETVEQENLLRQGRQFYDQGQYQQAIAVWQQAVKNYQTSGDSLNQALTLSYLSLAYQALGQWEIAKSSINQSLDLLSSLPGPTPLLAFVHAQALNTKGNLQLALGQAKPALETWKTAEKYYLQADDLYGRLGSQLNQAQALQQLGLYRASLELLSQLQQQLQGQADTLLKARNLESLGIALQNTGALEQAEKTLSQSLAISQKLGNKDDIAATLINLGNINQIKGNNSEALNLYGQAITTTSNPSIQLESRLNQLRIFINQGQTSAALALLTSVQEDLKDVPASRQTVYAQVNLAESLMKIESVPAQTILPYLTSAVQMSRSLNDQRAESYSLGTLGKLYESQQQWQTAQTLTEQALKLAQSLQANDIAYQWQWQLARLFKAQGNLSAAIATNTAAVKTLERVRKDLVAISTDQQFSFAESVEPVYRDLVTLLLTSKPGQKPAPENLKQAREVIESLQLAELENFFREACLNAQPKQIDEIDQSAAVIYPIILKDRLAVILSVSGQPLDYYETRLNQTEIEQTLDELLQSLNPAFSNQIRLELSKKVYDWLITPAKEQLSQHQIKTLVFVPDGILKNIPMSALYDGQQYLVEQYQVAYTPGLQLLAPRVLSPELLQAVVAGVSEENQGFAALPGVTVEVEEIGQTIPTEQLLNQEFTRNRFQQALEISPLAVVHLATHGQFSSNPEETFVLAWQDTIKVKDFQNILRAREQGITNPIELLVLSACQTASGDRQASLGLAGMAVRSGARSTVATLWAVKDESTALLMTDFYRNLSQAAISSQNKAEALRQAQLTLLKSPDFSHPYYWAAFVLVGNWR
jgi:CHAT domain-containing protein